ncbi:MAG: ATP-binding protein, partial [Candidatus Cloacimonadaceae bacterium]|nr:ATP-binding protein [Candidatus Cloacimonadaceae bacterium]
GMAHEINQPLSAITMSINNLVIKARKKELSESYLDDKIRKIMDDIQRIRNVIEHVRLFSRDQINSKPERIDIHQTLKDAIHLIAYDLGKHQIKLRMPHDEPPLITVGSKFKLEQVFLNLLTNARDAILENIRKDGLNARDPLIEIDVRVLEDTVEIAFSDNGTGMSEQSIARMFDPFYTTKSPEKGTGLGLSISYGIIHEMGGQILVSSEPGKITKITVVLPILEEQKWQS